MKNEEIVRSYVDPIQFHVSKLKLDYNPAIDLNELEIQWILKALAHFNGNKPRTARALGISRKTLYNKLHEYGEFDNWRKCQNEKTES